MLTELKVNNIGVSCFYFTNQSMVPITKKMHLSSQIRQSSPHENYIGEDLQCEQSTTFIHIIEVCYFIHPTKNVCYFLLRNPFITSLFSLLELHVSSTPCCWFEISWVLLVSFTESQTFSPLPLLAIVIISLEPDFF